MNKLRCVRCDEQLEEGFIPDISDSHHYFSNWVAGPPEKTFMGTAKVYGKKTLLIRACRCPACGKIELFAPESADERQLLPRTLSS